MIFKFWILIFCVSVTTLHHVEGGYPVSRVRRGLDLDFDRILQVIKDGKFEFNTWIDKGMPNIEPVFGVFTDFMTCFNVMCHPAQIIDTIGENIGFLSDLVETITDSVNLLKQVLGIIKNLPLIGPFIQPVDLILGNTVLPFLKQIDSSLESIDPSLDKVNNITDAIEDGCEFVKQVVLTANGFVQLVDSIDGSDIERTFLQPIADTANDTCFDILELLPSSDSLLDIMSQIRAANDEIQSGVNSAQDFSIYDVSSESELVKTLESYGEPIQEAKDKLSVLEPTLDKLRGIQDMLKKEVCLSFDAFKSRLAAALGLAEDVVNEIIDIVVCIKKGEAWNAATKIADLLGYSFWDVLKKIKDLIGKRKRRMVLNSVDDSEINDIILTLLRVKGSRPKRGLRDLFSLDSLKYLADLLSDAEICIVPMDILEGPSALLDTVLAPFNSLITGLFQGAIDEVKSEIEDMVGIDLDKFTSFDSLIKDFTSKIFSMEQLDEITGIITQNELFQKASSLLEDNFVVECTDAIINYLDPDVTVTFTALKCACIKDCGQITATRDPSKTTTITELQEADITTLTMRDPIKATEAIENQVTKPTTKAQCVDSKTWMVHQLKKARTCMQLSMRTRLLKNCCKWNKKGINTSVGCRAACCLSCKDCEVVEKLGPFGFERGMPFSDKSVQNKRKITNITICITSNNKVLSSLQFTYGRKTAQPHGSRRESCEEVMLAKREFIVKITGFYTNSISEITFTTTTGRIIGPYGLHFKGLSKSFEADLGGKHLNYIEGRAGDLVDMLTFYFSKC